MSPLKVGPTSKKDISSLPFLIFFNLNLYRNLITLCYEKIASITGTTVGGAKANYHQAIKKLEEFLKKS